MALFHVLYMMLIAVTSYAVYDSWRKNTVQKHFARRKQLVSFIPLWPKSLAGYTRLYRLLLVVAMLAAIALYARFLIQNY